MTGSQRSFEEDRLNAVRAFAQTMIVVDDEAGEYKSMEGASVGEVQIVEPDRHDAKQLGERGQKDISSRISHPLNQKALIESALDLGLVCAVVKPDRNQGVANKVANAAERADIVSLDWEMNDDGEKAISVIKEIIRRDAKKGGRLRLIAIYTGVNDRVRILNQIFQSISEKTRKHHNVIVDDDRIVSDNGLRIIWLFKSAGIRLDGRLAQYQVDTEELAERLQKEFSQLSEGVLSNVALATIAALRDATHHTLGKFAGRMDGPYFHHRAFLTTPRDAQDYAVSVVLSDLRSAVDGSDVGEKYAGANALKNRIEEMKPADGTFVLKHTGDPKVHTGKVDPDVICRIVTEGYSKQNQPNTFPSEKRVKQCFSSIFEKSLEEGRVAMMSFACLTSVRSHPENNLEKSMPSLGLGSIIYSKEKGYLLCLQASCDAVRVKADDKFFFIPLAQDDENAEHIVPNSYSEKAGSFLGLRTAKGSYANATSINFPLSAIDGEQVVKGKKRRGVAGHWFVDSDGKVYRWVANLKSRRAMRVAQYVSQQLTRIGFDEFEPFRSD